MADIPEFLDPATIDRLRVPVDGVCWWCRQRPADPAEHKFKRSDLKRMWDDGGLVWFGESGSREINGVGGLKRDRHGVLKFQQSLCSICNNSASQPFDYAYQVYSNYAAAKFNPREKQLDMAELYGDKWEAEELNLARYFVKHFGCQMVKDGIPVPNSMRAFLNGANDMPDVHLGLTSTDEVNAGPESLGLSLARGLGFPDNDKTRFTGMVAASYVGKLGVRFEWSEDGFEASWSQFFHYRYVGINRYATAEDLVRNRRQPKDLLEAIQWGLRDGLGR